MARQLLPPRAEPRTTREAYNIKRQRHSTLTQQKAASAACRGTIPPRDPGPSPGTARPSCGRAPQRLRTVGTVTELGSYSGLSGPGAG
eukprot:748318-Hanusia_phi.AAC.1